VSDLTPDARKLIRLARGDSPPPGDKDRLLALITARTEVPAPPGRPPPATPALFKAGLGAGALGGLALAVALALGPAPGGPTTTGVAVVTPPGASSLPPLEPASAPIPDAMPPQIPVSAEVPQEKHPVKSAPRPEALPMDTMGPELALLAQAREAVARGDLAGAREVLAQHQQQFPRGILAPERSVLSFLVACRSGQAASVRTQVRAFLDRSPRSPYAVSLRAACGEPEDR
jgi:hypothetical protein